MRAGVLRGGQGDCLWLLDQAGYRPLGGLLSRALCCGLGCRELDRAAVMLTLKRQLRTAGRTATGAHNGSSGREHSLTQKSSFRLKLPRLSGLLRRYRSLRSELACHRITGHARHPLAGGDEDSTAATRNGKASP